MKHTLRTLCLLLPLSVVVLGVAGCNITINGAFGGVEGSGTSKTESREVETFDQISFQGAGTVNVTVGKENSVTVTADDNLLELIETTVDDGKLTIRPTETISPKTNLVIEITTSKLSSVEIAGAATMDIKDAAGDSLDIEIAGASTITATGEVKALKLDVAGACKINLKSLKSETAKVVLAGASSGKVFASKSIDANAVGASSLTVYGSPDLVTKSVSGVGSIKIKD